MRKDSFKRSSWQHLSLYREQVLGLSEQGLYQDRARGHILPVSQRELNILPSIRASFWHWFDPRSIKLHKFFHHLSSSQAACFNLFYPFLENPEALPALMVALGLHGEATSGGCFEFIPDPTEFTNVDFMLPLASGARILVEMKYTEDGFKPQEPDDAHITKFDTMYAPRVASRLQPAFHKAENFLDHYQIARNILHLGSHPEDAVLFLVPRGNGNFNELQKVVKAITPPQSLPQVRVVYLEDLVTHLQDVVKEERVLRTLAEFRTKYLPT